ncbi:MAG: xanthine dehydrogenase accessory protein XdhC [Pseudomonadota bacterium]
MLDLTELRRAAAAHGRVARVVIVAAKGSTPRGPGTAMLVWADGFSGTIGGGRLEFEAISVARTMLAEGKGRRLDKAALGPQLNQCCGGAVSIVTEIFDKDAVVQLGDHHFARPVQAAPDQIPAVALRRLEAGQVFQWRQGWLIERIGAPGAAVFIHGAGHVGRGLAALLAPITDYDVHVADPRPDWITGLPEAVEAHLGDPVDIVAQAPDDATHFIMTHDHDLDLALCHAALQRAFGFVGLIGSKTKWARFRSRLSALGHSDEQIARITCPIGDPSLGKHPQAIAIGVAQALLKTAAPTKSATGGHE